jgi:cytochrome c-type biogenesis protein
MRAMDGRSFGALMLAGVAGVATARAEPRPQLPPIQLSDLTGQTFQLKEFLGVATVLDFWATWCGPCRVEMPELQKLYNELGGKGLVVLAVNVDFAADPQAAGFAQALEIVRPRIQGFLAQSGITLPVYLTDGEAQAELGVDRIPFSVLLDREGGVVRVYAGYSPESIKDLRQQVLGVLAERAKRGGK